MSHVPLRGAEIVAGLARNCPRKPAGYRLPVRSGPIETLLPCTALWTWQVTQPFATNRRRPRSASARGGDARVPASIARNGSSVVLLPLATLNVLVTAVLVTVT